MCLGRSSHAGLLNAARIAFRIRMIGVREAAEGLVGELMG